MCSPPSLVAQGRPAWCRGPPGPPAGRGAAGAHHPRPWELRARTAGRAPCRWRYLDYQDKGPRYYQGKGLDCQGRGLDYQGRGIDYQGRGIDHQGRGLDYQAKGLHLGRGLDYQDLGLCYNGNGLCNQGTRLECQDRGLHNKDNGMQECKVNRI